MKSRAAVLSFVTLLVSLLVTLFVALTAVGQQPAQSSAGIVPQLIPYSGVAKDVNSKPISGVVGITFLLYQQEQGGSPLWLETQNAQADARGNYSVQLGATSANGIPSDLFVTGEARWLAVQISGQAEAARVMLLSVPYAMKAGDAATVGGLPPSAFVLATPSAGSATPAIATGASSAPNSAPPPSGAVTGTGTVDFLPLWDTTSDIISSVLFQSGTGSTAKIGINNTKPASTLDVTGGATVRGTLSLPSTGTATATAGKNSQPLTATASAFNSSTGKAVTQTFQWQAEPAANDTSSPSGTLNLLFGSGTTKPTETGLNIASNGQITFAKGQMFPGTGNGTITGVTAGSGLSGGGTSGSVTLTVDTTQVPFLNAANTFTGNQTVNGNLSATGVVTGSSYQIGSNLFAFGSLGNNNAFLGFAGNAGITGNWNTAVGTYALVNDSTGFENTATGSEALLSNTTGTQNTATGNAALFSNSTGGTNTAIGGSALYANITGNYNTAAGADALLSNTGSYNTAAGTSALINNTTGSFNTATGFNGGLTVDRSFITGSQNTFLGYESAISTGTLSNATAIGANAEVTTSNALVLGSINGVNGATANTNVGIGTTAPASTLDVHGTGNFTGLVTFASGQTFPGTGTITGVTAGTDLLGGGGSGNVTLNVDTTKIVTGVTAGTDLTGGGTGGVQTINLDTTKVPQLNAANTFTGTQTVNGNLSATGVVTGSGFQIGSNLFDYGSYTSGNAFLGFAGNTNSSNTGGYNTASGVLALRSDNTGSFNTAAGYAALFSNGAGYSNTASGFQALGLNTTGSQNTASGESALGFNTTGNYNTASGYAALYGITTAGGNTASGYQALTTATGSNNTGLGTNSGNSTDNSPTTGSSNTYLGYETNSGTEDALNNATAIGANAQVTTSNAMVLGSINNVNSATASTNVGVGTTAPTYLLHLGDADHAITNFLRVEGPFNPNTGGMAASFGGYGNFGIDAYGTPNGRFYVREDGAVAIGTNSPIGGNRLTILQNAGPAIADGWTTYSSRRWKTDIHTLPNALAKVVQLRGVSYELKDSGKHEIGVIAEEVGAVVPEIVSWDSNGKDAQGVDYSRLTALLIEAVKEQQREISRLLARDKEQTRVLKKVTAQLEVLRGASVPGVVAQTQTSSAGASARSRSKR